MGYRLEVTDLANHNRYYGTKHYGYVINENEKKLGSYKYLLSIEKFCGDEFFEYGCENTCILNAEQFRKFIELYNEEYLSGISWKFPHNILEEDEMKVIYESQNDKRIRWL